VSEAEQILRSVRQVQGDSNVWYLAAKDEGHGFQKKANKDFFQAATSVFFERLLIK